MRQRQVRLQGASSSGNISSFWPGTKKHFRDLRTDRISRISFAARVKTSRRNENGYG